jgi:hypothetical protein
MGVSGEVLETLSCRGSGSSGWCRVGYRNQPGRELWAPTSALIFLGDGDYAEPCGGKRLTPR